MSDWKQRIDKAVSAATRAAQHGGTDPVTGRTVTDCAQYIAWSTPVECIGTAKRGLERIRAIQAGKQI